MNSSKSETFEKKGKSSVKTEKSKEISIKNSRPDAVKAAETTNSPAFQLLKVFYPASYLFL